MNKYFYLDKKSKKISKEDKEEESESDGSSSTSMADLEDLEDIDNEEVDLWQDEEEKIPEIKVMTKRLALINYDWKHIKAEDIFMILNSFKPTRGHIVRVDVYKSEYGKIQMQKELLTGPSNI